MQDVEKRLGTTERPAGIVDWSIDPATNSVVVHAEQATESSVQRWLETRAPSAGVRVAGCAALFGCAGFAA